ncbi:hypothetical protein F383_02043 [Gossypium arboreum]|uniref:Uncharacterized protein n=1 Tax=Gossypium arboreum TaxID=29729 RepID=A0A0B0Q006_GOSAR|nr:hypothetical protein F383_02043 [Gossypium arboreum]
MSWAFPHELDTQLCEPYELDTRLCARPCRFRNLLSKHAKKHNF